MGSLNNRVYRFKMGIQNDPFDTGNTSSLLSDSLGDTLTGGEEVMVDGSSSTQVRVDLQFDIFYGASIRPNRGIVTVEGLPHPLWSALEKALTWEKKNVYFDLELGYNPDNQDAKLFSVGRFYILHSERHYVKGAVMTYLELQDVPRGFKEGEGFEERGAYSYVRGTLVRSVVDDLLQKMLVRRSPSFEAYLGTTQEQVLLNPLYKWGQNNEVLAQLLSLYQKGYCVHQGFLYPPLYASPNNPGGIKQISSQTGLQGGLSQIGRIFEEPPDGLDHNKSLLCEKDVVYFTSDICEGLGLTSLVQLKKEGKSGSQDWELYGVYRVNYRGEMSSALWQCDVEAFRVD